MSKLRSNSQYLIDKYLKKGRPPKVNKDETTVLENDDKSSDIEENETINPSVDVDVDIETDDEDSVKEMIEINRDEDS